MCRQAAAAMAGAPQGRRDAQSVENDRTSQVQAFKLALALRELATAARSPFATDRCLPM